MSAANYAINRKAVLLDEGPGGTAAPGDPGKLTVFGITEVFEPHWTGWPRALALIAAGTHPLDFWNDAELMGHVDDYYMAIYKQTGADSIQNVELAGCLFGGVVNEGPKVIGWLQTILGLHADEVAGPATLAAIAEREAKGDGRLLFLELLTKRTNYYAHTAKAEFLDGLILRANERGA